MVMPLDVGELLSTGTAPCIAAADVPQFYVSFSKTGATECTLCVHIVVNKLVIGCIDLSRVRTLALCRTRRHPTIAYKYHGSLFWIIQLGTNITETCRWMVNVFGTDAEAEVGKYHLMCEIQKIIYGDQQSKVIHKKDKKYYLLRSAGQGHP